jgi:hypothetical protein
MLEWISPLILTTKTGQSFKKRYFARLWDEATTKAGLESVTLPGSDQALELHYHNLRGDAAIGSWMHAATDRDHHRPLAQDGASDSGTLSRADARARRAGDLQLRELTANKVCKPTANRPAAEE